MRVMRIVTRANVGGPARQVAALEPRLAERGVRTLVVTGVVESGEREQDLGLPEITPAAARDGGEAAHGWCRVPALRRRVDPTRDVAALATIDRLIRSFRPDVVHTHTSKAGTLGRIAAWWRGVPSVHTFHGLVLADYRGRVLSGVARRVERALALRTRALYAVSPSCRSELATLGVVPPGRVEVLRPAVARASVDPEAVRAARRRILDETGGGDDARRVVVGVGRLVPIKRPDRFLATARELPDAAFAWIGDGPLAGRLAEQSPPNVAWLGWRDDPAKWLAAADALLLPSKREGYPVAGIEASLVGTPTVGHDVPGVADLLAETGQGPGVPEREGAVGLARALAASFDAERPALDGDVVAELARATDPDVVAEVLVRCYRRLHELRGDD